MAEVSGLTVKVLLEVLSVAVLSYIVPLAWLYYRTDGFTVSVMPGRFMAKRALLSAGLAFLVSLGIVVGLHLLHLTHRRA